MAVARITEIKSSSKKGFEEAIANGVKRANKTLRNVKSAWVQDQEVLVDDKGGIAEYRVLLKVTFILKS